MANTFLAAQGKTVGRSLCESDLIPTARDILVKAKAARRDIVLPVDPWWRKSLPRMSPRASCPSMMSARPT